MTPKQELIEWIEKHGYDISIKAKSTHIAEHLMSTVIRLEIFTEHRDGIDQ